MLSDEQQRILEEYKNVTQLDDQDICLTNLENSNWSLGNAVDHFYSSGSREFDRTRIVGNGGVQPSQFSGSSGHAVSSFTRFINRAMGFFVSVVTLIFAFVSSLVLTPLSLYAKPDFVAPEDIKVKIQLDYGIELGFVDNLNYRQVCQLAKDSERPLCMYVHGHSTTLTGLRNSLAAAPVMSIIESENFILWLTTIDSIEGEKCADQFGCMATPSIVLGYSTTSANSSLLITAKYDGNDVIAHPSFSHEIESALLQTGALVHNQHEITELRIKERELRVRQEEAFAESLRQDRLRKQLLLEKQKKELEKQEAAYKSEMDAKEVISKNYAALADYEDLVISSDNKTEYTDVMIKLPTLARVQKRFSVHQPIQDLYYYTQYKMAEHESTRKSEFTLVLSYPRTEINDLQKTLRDYNITGKALLLVEVKETDDDDDDDVIE